MKKYEKQIRESFEAQMTQQEEGIVKIAQTLATHRHIVRLWPPRKDFIEKVVLPLFPPWYERLPPLTTPLDLKELEKTKGWFWPAPIYIISHLRMIPARIKNFLLRLRLLLKKIVRKILYGVFHFFYGIYLVLTFPFRVIGFVIVWIWDKITSFWGY
jgi:hypothetical protein